MEGKDKRSEFHTLGSVTDSLWILGQPLLLWEAQLKLFPSPLSTPTPLMIWSTLFLYAKFHICLWTESDWQTPASHSMAPHSDHALPLLFARVCLKMTKWDFQAGPMFRQAWFQFLSTLLTPKMHFSHSKTLSLSLCQACVLYTWGKK